MNLTTLPRARGWRAALVAILATLLAAAAGLVSSTTTPSPAAAAGVPKPDSLGTDFWLAFLTNHIQTPELTLFLTGPTATSGTAEVPGLAFSAPFTVTPGTVTSVTIPAGAMLTGGVQNLGVHVTALDEVTVYGLNRIQFTTDAFLGLPVDILGTEYRNLGWDDSTINGPAELGVVATADDTDVTITPVGGVPTMVSLDRGQTYQTQAGPLDGATVVATKPVALFGGNECANIPNDSTTFCDHVVEQIPPTSTWGKSFVAMPLATRTISDTFKILASEAGTNVSIDGAVVATLGAGGVHTTQLAVGSGHTISADKPILVGQYSNGTTFDGVTSDPFFMLIPPFEQFLGDYTITTPATGFAANYVNVVAPSTSVGQVTLDGVAIPGSSFSAIGSSGFSGAQLSVALGSHTLGGPEAFGVFAYGFDSFDSYGYPGGLSLAPVARVTNLTLTPATASKAVGTQHCVTANVTDQTNQPLNGIRVDFDVVGANPGSGFANTDIAGNAAFCYTGTAAGTDTITAATGSLTATATATWSSTPVQLGTRIKADPALASITGLLKITVTVSRLSATLTDSNGVPIPGKTLVFTNALGGPGCSAVTNIHGRATCNALGTWLLSIVGLGYRVSFAGDAGYLGSSARGRILLVGTTPI